MRAGLALDITTTDGKTFKGCTISQVEPAALRVIHADGAARIPYEKLPAALQKQFFDPAKVAAYYEHLEEEKRAAAARAVEERRQRAIAAAQAQEQREAADEARQREEAAQKAAVRAAEEQRNAAARVKRNLNLGLLGIAGILAIFVYFLPSIIGRHKANAVAIFALNLFLGWTVLGWVTALVWACTKDSALEALARERLNAPQPLPQPYRVHEPLPDREAGRDRGTLQDREGRYLE